MTDPRPLVSGDPPRLVGVRCTTCARASVAGGSCAACGAGTSPEAYGPEGTVYSATVVRIAVGDREPGYALAYVDLDDGPRVLAHVSGPAMPARVEARVRLIASRTGDPTVEVIA